HRILLSQNWDVWRLPPRSASLTRTGERLFRFKRLEGGRGLELRPREAAVARALLQDAEPLASSHRAVRLAETVPELAGEQAFIVEVLERFQAAGLLERTASTP